MPQKMCEWFDRFKILCRKKCVSGLIDSRFYAAKNV
jgi:hypothetical protein